MFEKVRKLKFSGAAFTNETIMDFFYKQTDQMCLVYGCNGSGKSTITRAFKKLIDDPEEELDINTSILLDKHDNDIILSDENKNKIYVFDEDYIQKNIKLQEDGLETIVMFGTQVKLEKDITKLQADIIAIEEKVEAQKEICEKYNNKNEIISPDHYAVQMTAKLKSAFGWAEREKEVLGNKINAPVPDDKFHRIVEKKPRFEEKQTIQLFQEKISLLKQAGDPNAKITTSALVNVPSFNREEVEALLAEKIENPILTEREKKLMKMSTSRELEKIKETFSDDNVDVCPFCFQAVTKEYKLQVIRNIENFLSEEVNTHKRNLQKHRIDAIAFDLEKFKGKIAESLIKEFEKALIAANEDIKILNAYLDNKCENPYLPIDNIQISLGESLTIFKSKLVVLEKARLKYNSQFDHIEELKLELQTLNKERAYYEIIDYYSTYEKQSKRKADEDVKLKDLNKQLKENKLKLSDLEAKKNNIEIAIYLINKNLRYILFTDKRLKIEVKGDKYCLLSNGNSVRPNDVSVAERNIIALSYFFTEMLLKHSVEDGYNEEMLVVMDDPVSSFDLENKVGIMSFLKLKLEEIVRGNRNSRVVIFTHDLNVAIGVEKIFETMYKADRQCAATKFELKNKILVKHNVEINEYNKLLHIIYEYANNPNADCSLTIGNIMRRVLEAFSTFSYQKSLLELSDSEEILKDLEDESKAYFGNFMYRLVLNGESHGQNQASSMIDPEFTRMISDNEKCTTARNVLCLMYLLNPAHIKAHLKEISGAVQKINEWCNDIKEINH